LERAGRIRAERDAAHGLNLDDELNVDRFCLKRVSASLGDRFSPPVVLTADNIMLQVMI
jgi:hypothetical protein